MYLVSAAYSLLMHAMHASGRHEWTRRTLTTIGEGPAWRAVKAELLERLVDWIVDKFDDDAWSLSRIKAVLAQTQPVVDTAKCKTPDSWGILTAHLCNADNLPAGC